MRPRPAHPGMTPPVSYPQTRHLFCLIVPCPYQSTTGTTLQIAEQRRAPASHRGGRADRSGEQTSALRLRAIGHERSYNSANASSGAMSSLAQRTPRILVLLVATD